MDLIVGTALRIVDEEGAEALSLRALAQRLKSSTATLYRHFTGRADLVARVVDRIIGEIELDSAQTTATSWRLACRAAAYNMFEVLSRHRNVAPLLGEHIPAGPNAAANREHLLGLLLATGFPPDLAARAYAVLTRYVLGFAMQLRPDPVATSREEAQFAAAAHRLDPARFPATAAVADSLPVPLEEEFALGLDLLLAGLAQLRDRAPEA